jgi:hypothetical protein
MAATAEWKAALQRNGWADIYLPADEFRRFLSDETARVAPLVSSASAGRDDARGFELVVLFGGALAVVAAAWQTWTHRRTAARVRLAESSPSRTNVAALATLTVAILVDVALIEWLGFAVASALLFGLAARAFGSGRPVRDLAVGLVLALVIQLGFTGGLGVALPRGPFG